MTRGYVCLLNGAKVKNVAYLCSDVYLSYYRAKILQAMHNGSIDSFINNMRKYNLECYGEKYDPCDGFKSNWIRPDKESKSISDWRYAEYGYIYSETAKTLSVYHYGKRVFVIKPEEYELYQYIFANDNNIYSELAYNPALLNDDRKWVDCMKDATALTLQELKDLVKHSENERVYLSDRHLVAPGGLNTYYKELTSSDRSKYMLRFVVSQTYSDKWDICIQTPFCRKKIYVGPNKDGCFKTEKGAMKGLRSFIGNVGTDKLFRTAEIYHLYYNAKDSHTVRDFLDSLDGLWQEKHWYGTPDEIRKEALSCR